MGALKATDLKMFSLIDSVTITQRPTEVTLPLKVHLRWASIPIPCPVEISAYLKVLA